MELGGAFASLNVSSSLYVPSRSDVEPVFVNFDENKYNCVICSKLLCEPMQTTCGHRVCRACLEERLSVSGEFPCPAADEDCVIITREQVNPDFSVLREINLLNVYCRYQSQGCQSITQLRRLKAHLAECAYRPVDCGYKDAGCTETPCFSQLAAHESECDYRPSECPHCHRPITTLHLNTHIQTECSGVFLDCPFACGTANLRRSQMDEHVRNCPARCKFHLFGCPEKGSAEYLEQHYTTDSSKHLDMIMLQLAKFKLENAELRKACERLNTEFSELHTRLLQQNQELERLNSNVTSLATQFKQSEQLYAKAIATQNEKLQRIEEKVRGCESLPSEVSTLRQNQARIDETLRTLSQQLPRDVPSVAALSELAQVQFTQQDVALVGQAKTLADIDLRMQCVETTSYEGVLIWRINEYRRRKADAATPGGTVSLYSQPFYSSRYGYKMCARVYLNGDGAGLGKFISLFFVVMKGDYDDILFWPFNLKVTMMLLDQQTRKRHLVDSFRPDPSSNSFQKPTDLMNIASGCPMFAKHEVIEANDTYLKDDALYFKIMVDTTEFQGP